ncbi:MAG: flp pilus-assembly TadE/G-like family protein [Actinomycetota bacterium]|nr:flp pilus-assembly TadE/G-like family protein [Actinomycetota bacterium]
MLLNNEDRMLPKHFRIQNIIIQDSGNITLPVLVTGVILTILFLVVLDICQVFKVREQTKNASDAASLAVAQNLLFFENPDCAKVAEEVTRLNNCTLVECICSYDSVTVTVEKSVKFFLIDKFIRGDSMVKSTSKTKVVYPWDEEFNYCDSYRFSF